MKYINNILKGLIIFLALNMTGCASDFLDTLPTGGINENTFTTINDYYKALNGLHRKMVSQDLSNQGMGGEPGFIIGREAHADDMTWDTQTWHQNYLNWSINLNATTQYNTGIWETYYQFILNANKIIAGIENIESTDALKEHIIGECLVFRAWAHFQLVQYYAKRYAAGGDNSHPGVPYREIAELTEMARNTVEEVYTKIHRDLDEAIVLLEGYNPQDVNHHSQISAYGIKARVALVQQNYPLAAEYASKTIEAAESNGFQIMTREQLTLGFANIKSDTKDAIYAAMTLDDQTVYFYSFYAYMSWNFNSSAIRTGIKCISQDTYDMMSETDLRRVWWDPTGEASVPGSSYNQRVYQNRKFKARSTANAVGDFAFMRLSEMYLIAAEAYARANDNTNAKKYFHDFIAERDPSYVDLGNTGDALAEEIMIHRRIELWGEGFRWFDLKRLNLPCERKGSNFDQAFCGFLTKNIDENGWYYEIPKDETDFNSLMEKNY